MPPMLIAMIFVVAMAAPAIVAVRYTVKPRRELALAHGPAGRHTRSGEGSMVLPVRDPQSVSTGREAKKLTLMLASANKQQQASALEHQVDDTIDRLILTR